MGAAGFSLASVDQRSNVQHVHLNRRANRSLFSCWCDFFSLRDNLNIFHSCFIVLLTDFNTLQYKCNYFLYRQFHIQENEGVVRAPPPRQLLCSENQEIKIHLLVVSFIVNNKTSRLYLIRWFTLVVRGQHV